MDRVPAGPDPKLMTESQAIGMLTRLYRTAPKMRVASADDDPEMHDRIRHILKQGEKLGEFYARTGLGRSQALLMSCDQILEFVEQAEKNRVEEGSPPATVWEPRRPPKQFFLDTFEGLMGGE